MQPGVTPGAILELHAARAAGGVGPGSNDPLTTQWYDTSGNGRHGVLSGFAFDTSCGWAGSGIPGDPYRLCSIGQADKVVIPDTLPDLTAFSIEVFACQTEDSSSNHATWCNYGRARILSRSTYLYAGVWVRESSEYLISSGTPNNFGVWVHWVITRDGASAKSYRNGLLLTSRSDLPATTVTQLPYQIGYGAATGAYKSIDIGSARIYPFALTPAQIAQNYTAGLKWLSRRPSGLLVYQSGRSAAAWQ